LTRILATQVLIQRVFNCQLVFDKQFFACPDRPERIDKDASRVFDRLAVRRACMVQPSRTVAAAAAVDHTSIRQREQERVSIDAVASMAAHGFPPACQFTPIFKHALTGLELAHREHTLSMNRRLPDDHPPHTVPLTDTRAKYRGRQFPFPLLRDR